MSNEINFKLNRVTSSLSAVYFRVSSVDGQEEILKAKQLYSDTQGNVSLGLGAIGTIGTRVKVYGDTGTEVGFKHFVGFADIVQQQARAYTNIVVIGASIVEGSFGRDLTTPNSLAQAALEGAGITGVNIYGYGWSGFTITQILPKISEAFAAFPNDDTLFIIHIGGNNVTLTRPYATATQTELDGLRSELDELYSLIESRRDDVIVASLTFRDYDDITADNEDNGSLPYITNEYAKRFNTRFQNKDGMPVVDLYTWSYANRVDILAEDNIHLTNFGKQLLREFVPTRIKYLLDGTAMPEPVSRVKVASAPVMVVFGRTVPYGRNFVDPVTLHSGVPLALTAEDDTVSGLTYSAIPSTADTSVSGISDNSSGMDVITPQPPLYVSEVTRQSIFTASAHNIIHQLNGLIAGEQVLISIVASRTSTTRLTRFSEVGNLGNTVTLDTGSTPPQLPVEITLTADANGVVSFIQETASNNYSYIGGFLAQRIA